VCDVGLLDMVATIHKGLRALDPGLTTWFTHHSFDDASPVMPKDNPRDKGGQR
jgi:hypothetical protein